MNLADEINPPPILDSGDLKFSHDNHKLELRVQPHDNGELDKKSQRVKDSSTLSGGEKSFSTICLLLALWHAAGCPIRGLDEYDVFMDPVNRKVATKMVRQFLFFVTPA
jgi:chromosome segregation ATPase